MTNDEYERTALELQDRAAIMSDDELMRAYVNSGAKAGDPYADTLAAALHERKDELGHHQEARAKAAHV